MRPSLPWFTIERLRTLVLVGGGLLVAAIAVFLAAGQWKRHFLTKDLPKRLGIDIEQQADGVNYTQMRKGKTLFKIHAARAVQMKKDGKTLLHDVRIDLYGEDGNRADTISGSEFEYDPTAGIAKAAGAVEITLMRPGVKPAIAQLKPGAAGQKAAAAPLVPSNNATLNQITDSEIHVKTSGLLFDRNSGVATTSQRVDFALKQGNGSSTGATYDSAKAHLVLDRDVELHVERDGGPVTIRAGHAEFDHNQQTCQLEQAHAAYPDGKVQMANALLHFRDDGSVVRLDGSGGVDLETKGGAHMAAPRGSVDFDEANHPRHGLLEGGAKLDMNQAARQIQGTSPTVRLVFDGEGELRTAHMEQGVLFNSQQVTTTAKGVPEQVHRSWKSQTADVEFARAVSVRPTASRVVAQRHAHPNSPEGHVEPRTIHGTGGVTVTSETIRGGVTLPSKLSADSVIAHLGPGAVLSDIAGTGHAFFEQRTAEGVHQSSSSDQLNVGFVLSVSDAASSTAAKGKDSKGTDKGSEASEISSVIQVGHVVLVQDARPPRAGSKAGSQNASPMRATANRSDYDGRSQLLHLSGSPRIVDGGLDLTAELIDFARASGDAFAHGNVKASWIGDGQSPIPGSGLLAGGAENRQSAGKAGAKSNDSPMHAVAPEAEVHQATGDVIFRGQAAGNQPRLWQGASSISAPTITLNQPRQTLVAVANGAANPVRTVLVNAPSADRNASAKVAKGAGKGKSDSPSVIRMRSGELRYSEGERTALLFAGSVGNVTAETSGASGSATIVSQQAEVKLLPVGVHGVSRTGGSAGASAGSTSVDRLTARGHVTVDWPERKGTGEKLVYLGEDGTFTLTGTSSAPPRITDQARGTVTGNSLIFHSHDDSVTVEGDGSKTSTETQSPR